MNYSNTDEDTYQEDSDFSLQSIPLTARNINITNKPKHVCWQDFYTETEKNEIITKRFTNFLNIQENKD